MKIVPNSKTVLAKNEIRFRDVVQVGVFGVVDTATNNVLSFWTTEAEAEAALKSLDSEQYGLAGPFDEYLEDFASSYS